MHLKVAFAAGETERKIQGYGEIAPVAAVEEGSAGAVKWDAATHRFSIVVRPGASGTATLELHQRSRF